MTIPVIRPVLGPPGLLRGTVKGGRGVSSLSELVVGCGLSVIPESPVGGGGGGVVVGAMVGGQLVAPNKQNKSFLLTSYYA